MTLASFLLVGVVKGLSKIQEWKCMNCVQKLIHRVKFLFMGNPRESSLGLEFFITIRTKLICS